MFRVACPTALLCAAALGAAAPASLAQAPDPAGFWTPSRLRRAEPLVPIPIEGTPGGVAARSSTSGGVSRRRAGIAAGNPRAFPNSANGVVFGRLESGSGALLYRCSGSVVNSPAKDLVMTSGHCVIDADSGANASELIFVPGYREGAEPFGEWAASSFATTAKWERSAGGDPDEAGDVAFLRIEDRGSEETALGSVVGALGIDFHRRRRQLFTQYGYPADPPYDGGALFRLRSAFVGSDTNFSPPTMAIRSDFTPGASGGPWTVGGRSPIALSVTDYSYEEGDGYLFGPYFGAAIQTLYRRVGGKRSGAAAAAPAGSRLPNAFALGRVTRHRRRGTATISATVPAAGRVVISGQLVRRSVRRPGRGRLLRLPVLPTVATRAALRQKGAKRVRVEVTFRPAGGDPVSRARSLTLLLGR